MRFLLPVSLVLVACHFDTSTEAAGDNNTNPPGVNPGQGDANMAEPDGPRIDPAAPDAAADAMGPLCYEPSGDTMGELIDDGSPGCTSWPSVDNFDGAPTITRSGTNLSLDFGSGMVFTGTVVDGAVSVTYSHQHSLSDGCTWQADELLVGTLMESNCELALSYSYNEFVAVSDGNCFSPCSYGGTVSMDLKPDTDTD